MPKCEFSETQFESYHARHFENLITTNLPGFFPTRAQEGHIGIDLALFGVLDNFFFQYKVPYKLATSSERARIFKGSPCYRIFIPNKKSKRANPQYEMLKTWSTTFRHVYYVAPEFNTIRSFSEKYQNIVNHSAMFNLRDMPDSALPDIRGNNHNLYYCFGHNMAYMYSEKKNPILKITPEVMIGDIDAIEHDYIPFENMLQMIRTSLITTLKEAKEEKGVTHVRNDRIRKLLEDEYSLSEQFFNVNYILRQYLNLDWIIIGRNTN